MKPLYGIGFALSVAACQPAPSVEPVGSAPSAVRPAVSAAERNGDELSRIRGFVQASCGGCHAVERHGLSPNPEAPPFAAIVNQQELTSETLSRWLRDAHNYPEEMDFYLDSTEVDAIAAYMLTLRDPNYEPQI